MKQVRLAIRTAQAQRRSARPRARHTLPGRLALLVAMLLVAGPAPGADDLLAELTKPLPGEVAPAIESMHGAMIEHYQQRDYSSATDAAAQIVASLEVQEPPPAGLLARAYLNLGILKWATEDVAGAVAEFDRAIALVEDDQGLYAVDLIAPLTGLGHIHFMAGQYDEAEMMLRRAQHLTHRMYGVYSLEQADLVRALSRVAERQGDREAATLQRNFLLRMNEVQYGEESVDLLPALDEMASYLESVGEYRGALMYQIRAMEIIGAHYGEEDLRMSQPLARITEIGMHDNTYRNRAEKAAQQRIAMLQQSDSADTREVVQSLVSLGDLYIVARDNDAGEAYGRAWELMAGQPELGPLADDLFGTPIRLVPKPKIYYVDRFPRDDSEEEQELYAEYSFTVNEKGRVTDLELLETNVPASRVKELSRHIYQDFRYRPQMVDGVAVATKGVRLRQQLAMPDPPQPRIEVTAPQAIPSRTP